MARIPANDYVGRISTSDPDYDLGKAIDLIDDVEGTGTPLESKWVNDDWGFKQAILRESNIVPSGNADTAASSQYLEGLKVIQGNKSVNDLSQAYVFPTVAAFKASNIEFLDGKIIHLLDRGADFTKISGQSGTGNKIIPSDSVDQSISLIINENTHAKHIGADITGVTDSYPALYELWEEVVAGNTVFNTFGGYTYKLTSSPNDTTINGRPCYFSTTEKNNVELKNGESVFNVTQIAATDESVLFESRGTDGFSFDNINLIGDAASVNSGDSITTLHITYETAASKNTTGNSINGKNCQGVKHLGDITDYQTNGFNSIYRPEGIKLKSLNIDNSEITFSLSNEALGYGLICQCAGDDATITTLNIDQIHRGIFIYGVKGVSVNGGEIKDSNAATVNVGSYASTFDTKIKIRVVQDQDLPTELTRVRPHEIGTTGGASLDLLGGRIHKVEGAEIDLDITGSASTNDTGFDLNKTTGDGADSSIEFRDIDITIKNTLVGVSRSFTIFTAAINQNAQNMVANNININGSWCKANARVSLLPVMESNLRVSNLTCESGLICQYGDLASVEPPDHSYIIFDNCVIAGSICTSGLYDVPIQIINGSRINEANTSGGNTPAYNKIWLNSYLGGRLIENTGKFDIYTHINDSSAMYSPDVPISRLVAGAEISTSNSTPLNIDLVAPSNVKTTVAADLYHDPFIGNSEFESSNPYLVKITAIRAGNSGFGVAYGRLVAYGVTEGDFTTGTFNLAIEHVINTGGQVFQASDFSVSIQDANTIRFSCSREAARMYVAVQRL